VCVCVRERERERERGVGREKSRRKMLSMTLAVRSAVHASFVRIERLSSVSFLVALYYFLNSDVSQIRLFLSVVLYKSSSIFRLVKSIRPRRG
jgi:hypothetical protein